MRSDPRAISVERWIPASVARHPALLAASCVCIGVFIGDAVDARPGLLLSLLIMFGLAGLTLSQSTVIQLRILGTIAICAALVTLGAWRIAVTNAGRPSASLTELTASERRVNIFARVDGVPFQKSSGWRVPLNLVAVKGPSGDVPVDGRVLLTSIPTLQGLRFGDYIRFDGRVFAPATQRNPGGFDYAEYLHRQGFDATARPESELSKWPQERHWSLYNIADSVRQWIRETFDQKLGESAQALLVGLLLGDTDRLPKPIYDAFRESGTSHLLAVSGANVWLVVGILLLPMYALAVPRWPRTIIALIVIVFFSFLTRNEPSVVRASLMVALILAGRLLWRPVAPINAVGAAGLIILLLSPAHLFRPGFQLSFAAVIGILVAVGRVEPLLEGFWRKRWVYTIALFFVASIAATVATAPISAWHFGTVPVAGLISNLIMVPLAGLTAHLGLLLISLHPVSSTASGWLAWLIDRLLVFSTQVAAYFADMSWATLSWPEPSIVVLSLFAIAVLLSLNWRHRYLWGKPCAYAVCFLVIGAAGLRLASNAERSATISLLDTGRQRIAVITSPSNPPIGIIDDPGLDDDLDQWVVQPFLHTKVGSPKLENWTSWRRLSKISSGPYPSDYATVKWTRFHSNEDSDSLGRPRVWADHWESESSDVVMIRDVPRLWSTQLIQVIITPNRPTVIILPAIASRDWLRDVIDTKRPTSVILYGRTPFGRSPEENLAFWRLRFPEVDFLASAVHGAISIEVSSNHIVTLPTVPDRIAQRE